ncbi:MAG: hypothetical protein ACK5IJ_11115 [Mangrovibacterium sp.]
MRNYFKPTNQLAKLSLAILFIAILGFVGCSEEEDARNLNSNEDSITILSSDYTDIANSAASLLDESITEALGQLKSKSSSSDATLSQAIERIYTQKIEANLGNDIEELNTKTFNSKSTEIIDTLKVERYTNLFGEWMGSIYEDDDEVSEDQIQIDLRSAYADFENYVAESQELNEQEKLTVLNISYLQLAQLSVVISRFDELDEANVDELQTKGWLKKAWNKIKKVFKCVTTTQKTCKLLGTGTTAYYICTGVTVVYCAFQ